MSFLARGEMAAAWDGQKRGHFTAWLLFHQCNLNVMLRRAGLQRTYYLERNLGGWLHLLRDNSYSLQMGQLATTAWNILWAGRDSSDSNPILVFHFSGQDSPPCGRVWKWRPRTSRRAWPPRRSPQSNTSRSLPLFRILSHHACRDMTVSACGVCVCVFCVLCRAPPPPHTSSPICFTDLGVFKISLPHLTATCDHFLH